MNMGISVYSILHKASGRFYVGQSSKTTTRFSSHRNMLRRGDHHCSHLQRAWDLYGESEFEFVRLQPFSTAAEAIAAEQKLLDIWFPTGSLFNSARSNDPKICIQLATSKEARKRTSVTRSTAPHLLAQLSNARKSAFTPEAIARRVASTRSNGVGFCAAQRMPVRAMNHTTGKAMRFISVSEAARITGLSKGNISSCCNGTRLTTGGFSFTYEWMLVEPESESSTAK